MNIFVVVLLGVIVSIALGLLIKRRPITLGTILLGTLGAILGEVLATAVLSDYQYTNLILPTLAASALGSILLVLFQRLLMR